MHHSTHRNSQLINVHERSHEVLLFYFSLSFKCQWDMGSNDHIRAHNKPTASKQTSRGQSLQHKKTRTTFYCTTVLTYLLILLYSTTVRYYTGRLNQNRNRNRNRNRLHLSSIVSPISHPIISVSVIASHPISHPTLTNRIQSHLES